MHAEPELRGRSGCRLHGNGTQQRGFTRRAFTWGYLCPLDDTLSHLNSLLTEVRYRRSRALRRGFSEA
jgi:hypothetical protein